MRRLLIFWITGLLLGGCNDDDGSLKETVVVDGLVYAGQPIGNINISLLSTSIGDAALPYTEAPFVVIRSRDQDFPLWQQPDQPGTYFDPTEQIPVVAGDTLILIVPFQDTLALSFSVVPFPPVNMALAQTVIPLDAADIESDATVKLAWEDLEERSFTAKLSVIDPNAIPINPNGSLPPQEFILDPIQGNTFEIPYKGLLYYGTYRLVLYAVNTEYTTFFSESAGSQFQQSTNIINGLGIFTALNSDTTYLSVVPK